MLVKPLLRPLCFSNNFRVRNLSGEKESPKPGLASTSVPANDLLGIEMKREGDN